MVAVHGNRKPSSVDLCVPLKGLLNAAPDFSGGYTRL